MFTQLSKKYKHNCAIEVPKYSKFQESFVYKKLHMKTNERRKNSIFIYEKSIEICLRSCMRQIIAFTISLIEEYKVVL